MGNLVRPRVCSKMNRKSRGVFELGCVCERSQSLTALCLPLLIVTPWGRTAQLRILFMEASASRIQAD